MIGLWDRWNATDEPQPYGLSDTYWLGAEWLAPCSLIEDWGCGRGYMRTLIEPRRYRGLDGSDSPWTDVVADLRYYRTATPGLFMRHVLEHNYGWRDVLENAVASFTQRMFLAIFTPPATTTTEIAFAEDPGVPDIAFNPADLEGYFDGVGWTKEALRTPTQYGAEVVYRLIKGNREEL